MNQTDLKLDQMTDIFLPVVSENFVPDELVFLIILAATLVLYYLWQYFKTPIVKLERHLKQGKLSPREAAHRLASFSSFKSKQLQQQINQIRFQRQTPEINALLILIDKAKHDR